MSGDVALQAMFDRFLGSFVVPLIRGGSVLVSYPLGEGAVDFFRFAEPIDPALPGEIARARQIVLEEITPSPLPETLTEEDIFLLAALHNVLLCDHQEVVSGFRGQARWKHCLTWAREHLTHVRPCASADSALSRHSLLHQVTSLERVDTVLQTRRSTTRYIGQDPPPRALIWPGLRMLRRSEEVVGFQEVAAIDEARTALTEILESSPLTCLLSMPYSRREPAASARTSVSSGARGPHDHLEPGLDDSSIGSELRWTPEVVIALSRTDICRCVTYRHLSLGLHATGPHLARALLSEIGRGPEIEGDPRLAFSLRYIVNLQLTHVWTSGTDDLEKPLEVGWGEALEDDRKCFFGWFAAALARADRIDAPTPVEAEHAVKETRFRNAAAAVAGPMLEHAARHVDLIVPPRVHSRQEAGFHG
jgi:hypothetical protein